MKKIYLHLVSDSTGETVSSVARACMAQFENIETEEQIWPLVRTKSQLEKVIEAIGAQQGIVMYTLVDVGLREYLKQECAKRSIPCIGVLAGVIQELSNYLGQGTNAQPGKQHELNEEYYQRVEAINYTLAHDDGQAHWDLADADVILVGVSRTSKSPTCVYLAYKGYRAANVPFVLDCPLPPDLLTLKTPLIVGLTISPDRLLQIRKTRLASLNQGQDTNYVDREMMDREIAESRKLFAANRWPVIDVTRRSVEETAATIVQHLQRHREKMKS